MEVPNSKRTFRHRFRGGVRAEVVLDLEEHRARNPFFKCTWEGKPTRRILDEYKRWTLMIESTVANELNQKLMHVFMLGNGKYETWVFVPGQAPKRVWS
jgi:hypothetical protein